ncbi:MAG: bifunctional alpha,alpha-trehalose-phosphate synthase (UDP-forming)/trehalose-phosphatase [Bacteroidetes bacterium]|nr:bifunctional alpha,alpha-trehalose-phosphate synthase (UDP-forming)/trehalose-phosphatase [Bacteroidota bacterium]
MKLFIVSNRLPVTFEENGGDYRLKKSAGGLVTGISAYLESMNTSSLDKTNYNWIGWPGISFPEKKEKEIKENLSEYKLTPIFISEKIMDKFYFGFCNKTVWPLFHYFPAYTVYDNEMWETYRQVNEKFCDSVCDMADENDIIWIHDYHLLLLPGMIRKRKPNAKIGFFLHIPFPHFEMFRLMPDAWRKEILNGMLGADLSGFHTYDYSRYFHGCVLKILGHDNYLGEIQMSDRIVKVETFQMGIDFNNFDMNSNNEKTNKEVEKLKRSFRGQKVVLSIDRLDYTKGIVNRMKGFRKFLELNPDWHGKVTMLAVTVPSRIGIEKYSQMKREIDELIGKINGQYGTMNWTPIIYQYRSFHDEFLLALYRISDVALITPLRDGMNLIAKEYIASRSDCTGVLILSEMAGASKEMIEALAINPNHTEDIAVSLKTALEMSAAEQIKRNTAVRKRLKSNDVIAWANNFILALYNIKAKQRTFEKKYLDEKIKSGLIADYSRSKKRIIFLDYDGTLVPFDDDPGLSRPDKDLLELLARLSSTSGNHVVVISGRDMKTLDEWFRQLNVSLVAEHGVWIKKKFKKWKIAQKLDDGWKGKIKPVLDNYTNLLAGSFYEEKSHSIVWHFRKSDKVYGEMVANELTDSLKNITSRMNLQALRGKNIVEIRNIGIDKGTAVKDFRIDSNYDFILSIGDDWTDEDMFRALPSNAYSIKVGMEKSYSKFNLHNYQEVRSLLKELINAK